MREKNIPVFEKQGITGIRFRDADGLREPSYSPAGAGYVNDDAVFIAKNAAAD